MLAPTAASPSSGAASTAWSPPPPIRTVPTGRHTGKTGRTTKKEQSGLDNHHREEAMNKIKELQDFIARQETDITEFDEALVKKLIEKITVFADHFTVEFKPGIIIDIEA